MKPWAGRPKHRISKRICFGRGHQLVQCQDWVGELGIHPRRAPEQLIGWKVGGDPVVWGVLGRLAFLVCDSASFGGM